MPLVLTPARGLVFRITHVSNLPWILEHGLSCGSGPQANPDYVQIGDAEVIGRRRRRAVPIPPGGMLSDYVPFYFTPWSPMLYNIVTGYGGVPKRSRSDLAILVASLHALSARGIPFVFTNGHALPLTTYYTSDLAELDRIDWQLLNSRSFRRDPDDPGKLERYQAEALVHRGMPVEALTGIACYDTDVVRRILGSCSQHGVCVPVRAAPEWYL